MLITTNCHTKWNTQGNICQGFWWQNEMYVSPYMKNYQIATTVLQTKRTNNQSSYLNRMNTLMKPRNPPDFLLASFFMTLSSFAITESKCDAAVNPAAIAHPWKDKNSHCKRERLISSSHLPEISSLQKCRHTLSNLNSSVVEITQRVSSLFSQQNCTIYASSLFLNYGMFTPGTN